jgi:two-component system, chemotaxis family, chemotaxis protein CheY
VQKKTVFIVDDDQGIRDALTELLEMEGFAVRVAANGEEGLRELRQMEPAPDLILLDLTMPVLDGIGFRSRQREEKLRLQVPVILMSADARIDEKQESAEVAGHLRKPMDIDQAVETVRRFCG